MTSVDDKDAYYPVLIPTEDRKYLHSSGKVAIFNILICSMTRLVLLVHKSIKVSLLG